MHAQDQQKQALQSQFRRKRPKAIDFYYEYTFKAQKDLIFQMVLKFVVSKKEKHKDYPWFSTQVKC